MARCRPTTGIFAVAFVLLIYILYSTFDKSAENKRIKHEREILEISRLEAKLAELESGLSQSDKLMEQMRGQLAAEKKKTEDFVQSKDAGKIEPKEEPVGIVPKPKNVARPERYNKNPVSSVNETPFTVFTLSKAQCGLVEVHNVPSGNVQMLDVYTTLPFDNVDGGVWKQGWPITIDKTEVEKKENKLKVFVIPHSHCDPGWIHTFDDYYTRQVRPILDGMVKKLTASSDMKFIYAEMSFFSRWWDEQSAFTKDQVRALLKNGQFEIVTGAWVMTDEANTHYYNIINEMTEGHQFLVSELNYRPTSHWSIDPFGLSSTLPWIVKASNLTDMVVQRVHYSIKKHLAKTKQLEFVWRQMWAAKSTTTDIRTHLFPFYSYDVPHTCGPEPAICCQFDFKRLPGGGVSCPWNRAPQKITDGNVKERAATILDQWRKKSTLYKTNVVLIPLGDDFRYDTDFEWDAQHENYKKLFDEMNNDENLNVHAQFGTLTDYFKALNDEPAVAELPTLTGDFFTYADRDDHYWSGYFTSRAYHKRLDRHLMHYLRSAELLLTWARAAAVDSSTVDNFPFVKLYAKLVHARRQSALFQHHDGVTGTAKDVVVVDYAKRMHSALADTHSIIASCSHFIMSTEDAREKISSRQKISLSLEPSTLPLQLDMEHNSWDSLPKQRLLAVAVGQEIPLIIFNPLGIDRTDVICIKVDTVNVVIKDTVSDQRLKLQIEPIVESKGDSFNVRSDELKACFVASIKVMGLHRFTLSREVEFNGEFSNLASILSNYPIGGSIMPFTSSQATSDFELSNKLLTVKCDGLTGQAKNVKLDGGSEQLFETQFIRYGARRKGEGPVKDRGGDSLSGAYLFLPDGEGRVLTMPDGRSNVLQLSGPIRTRVMIRIGDMAIHEMRLCNDMRAMCSASLEITNTVDISGTSNYELAMRLATDIKSEGSFYTDLNGAQLIRRNRMSKLPLQANVYPTTTAVYVEDDKYRMTLLTGQAAGAASHKDGQIEIFIDRRLNQDDDRGLFQGVTDNVLHKAYARVVFERNILPSNKADMKVGFHTPTAQIASNAMQYPMMTMFRNEDGVHDYTTKSALLSTPLLCDTHILTMRTRMPSDESTSVDHLLIAQRYIMQCSDDSKIHGVTCGDKPLTQSSFTPSSTKFIGDSSLTGLYDGRGTELKMDSIELKTMRVEFGK